MLLDNLKRNLKKHRSRRHLSQVRLADKAGLSVSYVCMLEQGKRSPPLETIEKLAGALEVAPQTLLANP